MPHIMTNDGQDVISFKYEGSVISIKDDLLRISSMKIVHAPGQWCYVPWIEIVYEDKAISHFNVAFVEWIVLK